MIAYSDELARNIDQALTVVNDEIAALTEARRILVGEDFAPGRKSARTSAANGDSTQRAMDLIVRQPGITAGAIGPALGMGELAGYPLVKRLLEAGRVRKDQRRGWHPA